MANPRGQKLLSSQTRRFVLEEFIDLQQLRNDVLTLRRGIDFGPLSAKVKKAVIDENRAFQRVQSLVSYINSLTERGDLAHLSTSNHNRVANLVYLIDLFNREVVASLRQLDTVLDPHLSYGALSYYSDDIHLKQRELLRIIDRALRYERGLMSLFKRLEGIIS